MLELCYYYVGSIAPIILFIYSLLLLRNKSNLLFYYNIGIFINTLLNLLIKGITQQPRPTDDPKLFNLALKYGKPNIFKTRIPFNIFGMPSGHAQSCMFSTMYIYLSLHDDMKILFIYLFFTLITMTQRYIYKRHTCSQIIIGAIVGGFVGYFMFHLAQLNLKGIITEKPDDNAKPFL